MAEAHRNAGRLMIAGVTIWEIALLDSKGKIAVSPSIEVFLERVSATYRVLPLDGAIAIQGTRFSENYPADPADRQIGATALAYGLTLVTADQKILKSGEVPCIW